MLHGRTYLRAGIVNYLTTEADIDHLLDTLRRLGFDPIPIELPFSVPVSSRPYGEGE